MNGYSIILDPGYAICVEKNFLSRISQLTITILDLIDQIYDIALTICRHVATLVTVKKEASVLNNTKTCKLENCNDNINSWGWCFKHYQQFRRKGYATLETRLTPNPIRKYGKHALIGLRNNQGIVVEKAIIDTEDIEKVNSYKWYWKENKYVYGMKEKKRYYLHRIVMDCPKGMTVNHWDHNALNNRKDNLIVCTQQQNTSYRRKIPNKKYKYIGVAYREDCSKKWQVRISQGREILDLGQFSNEKDAAYVYDQVIMQLRGKFAYTNFKYE